MNECGNLHLAFTCCVVSGVVFLSRYVPVLVGGKPVSGDGCFLLWFARVIRSANFRVPKGTHHPPFMLPGVLGYPALWSWLLAALPEGRRERLSALLVPSFDALSAAVLFQLVTWVNTAVLHGALTESDQVAFALLVMMSPALTHSFHGPRSFELSGRGPSECLFWMGMAGGVLCVSGRPWWFAVFAVCMGLMANASLFGLQTVLLSFVPALAVSGEPIFAVWLPVTYGVGLALSLGHHHTALKSHIAHSRFYLRHWNETYIGNVNRWSEIASLPRLLLRDKKRAAGVVLNNTYLFGAIMNPQLLALAYGLSATGALRRVTESHSGRFLLGWTAGTVVAWLLTGLPSLRFMGAAFRYLEYSLPAQWLLVLELWPGRAWLWCGAGAYCLCAWMLFAYMHVRAARRKLVHTDMQEVIAFLSTAGDNAKVRALHDADYPALELYGTCNLLRFPILADSRLIDDQLFEMLYGQTPSGREANPCTIEEVSDRWALDFLVAPTAWLSAAQGRDTRYRLLDNHSKVFENVSYVVFQAQALRGSP